MKKLNKFFVFVLSLFCILGMVTPVFAEGEESDPFELVSYEIVNIANSSKVTPVDDTVQLEVGKKYAVLINYKGTIPDDYLNPEPIAAFGDKLKCDLLDVQYGGSDGGPDENGEYLGTIANNITPVKEGKVTLEIAPGKNVTFYAHNDDASTLLEKVNTTFQENIKNHTFLVSENSIEKDIHDQMTALFEEAKQSLGILSEEMSIDYEESEDANLGPNDYYYFIYFTNTRVGGDGFATINYSLKTTIKPEVSDDTPTTSVSSDADKIVENTKASYSEEQQAALKEGGKADVKVSVSQTTPTAEDKKLVEAQLNSTNKIAMYLDLGVKVSIKDADGTVIGSDVALSETGTPVQFTVALDDSFINTNNTVDRTYQVVRIHEGKVDVLPATFDPETKTITFESDKFSTYALMYTDTPKTSKTPVTSDDGNVALYAGMGVIALAAVVAMIFFKKKNA